MFRAYSLDVFLVFTDIVCLVRGDADIYCDWSLNVWKYVQYCED